MTLIPKTSFKFRMLLCASITVLIIATAMAYMTTVLVSQTFANGVDTANASAIRHIANELEGEYPGLDHSGTLVDGSERLVWDDMPEDLADDRLDEVLAVSGLQVAVFRWVPNTQEFVRVATTLEMEGGQRAVGATLARGAIYEAMMAGEPFRGEADILGHTYHAYFQPIEDLAGNPTGIFFSGSPNASLAAATRPEVINSLVFAVVVLMITLVTAFYFVSRSLRPLSAATQSIVALTNGYLEEDITVAERDDEIGKISQALLVLQRTMQEAEKLKAMDVEKSEADAALQRDQTMVFDALTEGLERLGNLDLTAQIESRAEAPFPADYEGLRTSFNMLVDSLSETVEAIKEVANEVNSDARELAGSSVDLSSRTESQAATLEESAAALEELSASVQSTAANASDAETTTNENRAVAKRAGDIVETAISAMSAIEDSSRKITRIISVIDDIAFQTNLLALNAGVEAARAGEAGRGFAVVASEVRALAQHSSASAQEIKALIASSSEHVENGSKLVRNAGDSIGDIVNRADRVASLVSDIAVSAKEQSIGVTEINAGVRELDAATQQNAAMAEEASAASEGLTAASDRLANHLARFQVASAPKRANWAAAAMGEQAPPASDVATMAEAFAAGAPMQLAATLKAQSQDDVFRDF